jgi:hypothetical protein
MKLLLLFIPFICGTFLTPVITKKPAAKAQKTETVSFDLIPSSLIIGNSL